MRGIQHWMATMSLLLVAHTSSAQRPSTPDEVVGIPEIIPHEVFWTWSFLTPDGSFPMVSADGTEVAILYGGLHFDGDRSIVLDVVSVQDSRLQNRFVLQNADDEGDTDPQGGRRLINRLDEPSAYLEGRRFETMIPFYQLPIGWPQRCYAKLRCASPLQAPADPTRSAAAAMGAEGIMVHFDFQSGTLTIGEGVSESDAPMDRVRFTNHWPALESRPARQNQGSTCRVQAVPHQGWVGSRSNGSRILVLRISYLTEDLACTQSDQWMVARLPE